MTDSEGDFGVKSEEGDQLPSKRSAVLNFAFDKPRMKIILSLKKDRGRLPYFVS